MRCLAIVSGVLGLVVFSAACSSGEDVPPFPLGSSDDLGARLEADLGAPVYAEQHDATVFVTPLATTRVLLGPGDDPRSVAGWIQRYAADFGVRPGDELVFRDASVDALGIRRVSFRVGLPEGVAAPDYRIDVSIGAGGELVEVQSDIPPLRFSNATPIGADHALKRIQEEAIRSLGALSEVRDLGLSVSTDAQAQPLLAYSALVGDLVSYRITIAANDGLLIRVTPEDSHLFSNDANGLANHFTGPDRATSPYLPIEYSSGGASSPELYSLSLPPSTTQSGAHAKIFVSFKSLLDVTSSSRTDWDALGPAAGAAVDAYSNAQQADATFRKLGLRYPTGWSVPVVVHRNDELEANDDKSRFTSGYGRMFNSLYFGDGGVVPKDRSGLVGLAGRTMRSTAFSPDVVAHELAHSVLKGIHKLATDAFAPSAPEEGALNEGIADVMGKVAEHARFPFVRPDLVGVRMFTDQRGLRNLAHPGWLPQPDGSRNPSHIADPAYRCPRGADDDFWCSHARGSVVSHAFYLMTFGGVNDAKGGVVERGVDWDIATSLWLGLVPTTIVTEDQRKNGAISFPLNTLRKVALDQIAKALVLGSSRAIFDPNHIARSVACAWEAVGVLQPNVIAGLRLTTCRAKKAVDCRSLPDGTYCDEVSPFSATRCANHSIAGAPPQCPSGSVCQRKGFFFQNEAAVIDGKLQCAPDGPLSRGVQP